MNLDLHKPGTKIKAASAPEGWSMSTKQLRKLNAHMNAFLVSRGITYGRVEAHQQSKERAGIR